MTNPLYDNLFARHAGKATVFLRSADGTQITHAEFLEMSARFAQVLVNAGLTPGDRIAVQVGKSPEALAIYAACAQTGIIFLPLNTAYTPAELKYFVDNSGAKMLLCDSAKRVGLVGITEKAGAVIETLDEDGTGSLPKKAAGMASSFDTISRSKDDLAAFLYTSGTTGRSKGAMLTQENLLSNAEVLAKEWRFSSDDVLLHALPIFHTHGLFVATNIALLTGATLLFMPKFDLEAMVELMPQATTMMGVPTFYTRLLSDARFNKELTDHMRLFVSGSAPLLAETHVQFEERTGHRILERYGMTETNMNTSNPYEGERRAGTVGFALPGVELKITDAQTGAALPDGEIGEIEVRGANVFKGYWQMPEKTAEELREDGFFITGDLGRIDEDGYVSIVGRNKDMIIAGGYNIYPKEIELVLDEQPGVMESAVIGVPHPDFGESVVGILVAEGDGPDVDKIKAGLGAQLARFKQPQRLIVIDELPRNTMGKVQKNVLRETYKDLFA